MRVNARGNSQSGATWLATGQPERKGNAKGTHGLTNRERGSVQTAQRSQEECRRVFTRAPYAFDPQNSASSERAGHKAYDVTKK